MCIYVYVYVRIYIYILPRPSPSSVFFFAFFQKSFFKGSFPKKRSRVTQKGWWQFKSTHNNQNEYVLLSFNPTFLYAIHKL